MGRARESTRTVLTVWSVKLCRFVEFCRQLLSEKVTRPHERAHRPISISSVPVPEGIEIRQVCRVIGSLVRALGKLPGRLG